MTPGQGERVSFRCIASDHWPLGVIGNIRELGSWQMDAALPMQPQDSNSDRKEWTVQAILQHGQTIEYKFVKLTDQGPIWESGDNRRLTIIPGGHTITDTFRG